MLRLTLTQDVFKQASAAAMGAVAVGLTLTQDVFKHFNTF